MKTHFKDLLEEFLKQIDGTGQTQPIERTAEREKELARLERCYFAALAEIKRQDLEIKQLEAK